MRTWLPLVLAVLVTLSPCHLVTLSSAEPGHERANPLYHLLREKGVPIAAKVQAPLPAPRMADGLDSKEQIAVIKRLIGEDIDFGVFADDSINAPQLLLPLRTVKGGDSQAPARQLDLYFIAHGNLKKLTEKSVLDRALGNDRNKAEGKELTAEDLKKHGITIAPENQKHEVYGYTTSNLMDRVEIHAVGHSYWSETPESIVQAAEIDERFARSSPFPNQWRSAVKEGPGVKPVGPAHPYEGVGYYVKATRLKDPNLKGAIFLEVHLIFTEPVGWFEGTNQLTSKLPAVIQDTVRKLRRALKK